MNKNKTIEINGEYCNIQGQRYIVKDGKLILEIEYSYEEQNQWEFETKQFVISENNICTAHNFKTENI